jgi:hypothetical protein
MNKFKKYCANTFVLSTEDEYLKGDIATITTKYGKEINVIVFNFLGQNFEKNNLYSCVREDGENYQTVMKRRAERRISWANSQAKISNKFYKNSKKNSDFLSLAEPIKIGHHSENRHRRLIETNNINMMKSIQASDKANCHEEIAKYYEAQSEAINLSMPESLEFYKDSLEQAKEVHLFYKNNPDARNHSYTLTYAKKRVNEITKKYELAKALWD